MISDVQRNGSGAIVTTGGTVDPSTKKIVSTVSWTLPLPSSVSSETYYQRYLGNAAWTQTTQAEFTAGTRTNTSVTSTGGGQVELSAGGGGSVDWATPTIAGSYDQASSLTDATDVYVDSATNRAYITIGTSLRIINISNPASPALLGTYTAAGNINSVYVSGNYAYIATASDTSELRVVNVTNPASPTLAASVDLTGANDGLSVFVSGNFTYVGRAVSTTVGQNELYIVNVTTPTAPTVSGSLNFTAAVNSVYVSGNFAYAATSVTTAELAVVNVTTPTTPTQAGIYNASGTSIATDVFAVGTTVYFTKANNTSGTEFFIVNAATPATPTLVGSYEAGANLNGVYVVGNDAFLATAITNAQLRILNITTPATPTVRSSLSLTNTSNDIVQVGNYIYIASTHDTRELTVVQGTVTGGGYQTTGTFESSTLDTGAVVGFNYLTFALTEPASTNIQFQIATNTDNVTWNYTGPDGTAGTFYTSPGAIPLNKVDGRYLRYKASFSGPGTSTPVLSDASINYSP